jgi:hypothetical protein
MQYPWKTQRRFITNEHCLFLAVLFSLHKLHEEHMNGNSNHELYIDYYYSRGQQTFTTQHLLTIYEISVPDPFLGFPVP